MSDSKLESAVKEAKAYLRLYGLTDEMIADIAHDHRVSVKRLQKALDEG